jgi:hypothetical protein
MRTSMVWMVHAITGVEGRKGLLSLEGDALIFRPASNSFGHSVFRLSEIKKVRRMRASPVLELRFPSDHEPAVVGFYFVRPPDLTAAPTGRPRLFPRRAARKEAISQLWKGQVRKKDEVAAWQRAIEEARREGTS